MRTKSTAAAILVVIGVGELLRVRNVCPRETPSIAAGAGEISAIGGKHSECDAVVSNARGALARVVVGSPEAGLSLSAAEVETILREPEAFFPDAMPRRWRQALLKRWAELEPTAAAGYARQSGSADMIAVLNAWWPVDAAAARGWLDEFGNSELSQSLFQCGDHKSLLVGPALALLDRLPEHSDLGIDLLCRASSEDMRAWLHDSPSTPARQSRLVQFSQVHPDQARAVLLDAIQGVPDTPERAQLLNVIVGRWARDEPIAATKWVEQMADPQSAAVVWGGLTAQWAQKNPVQAAQIAAKLPPGPAQDKAVISAVSGWALMDPPAAAAWVVQFPDGNLRKQAMRQLMLAWSMRDRPAAESWLAFQPPGPLRDFASDFLKKVASRTPSRS